MRKEKNIRSRQLPCKFLKVGDMFTWKGITYKVVERDKVEPYLACAGCGFAQMNCPDRYACSKFDRIDNTNVWFVPVVND